METAKYIIKGNGFTRLADSKGGFRLKERTKMVRDNGLWQTLAGTGVIDRSVVIFFCNSVAWTIGASRVNLARCVRKIRVQELSEIQAIDAKITELQHQRQAAIKNAWLKANKISGAEAKREAEKSGLKLAI